MRIERIEIEGFGCLKGVFNFVPDGANLIVAPNREGKSTLINAILAALYDFDPTRSRKVLSEREAYRPLQHGVYRVALVVQTAEGRRTIVRDFEENQVRVFAGSLHDREITERFVAGKGRFEVGERLLGLSRDEFKKTAYVGQDEVAAVGSAGDLTRHLQRIADSEAGQATAAEAMAALQEALKGYPGVTRATERPIEVETEMKRLQEEIQKISSRMAELEAKRGQIDADMAELTRLESGRREIWSDFKVCSYLAKAAELKEIEERLASSQERKAAFQRLEAEREDLAKVLNKHGRLAEFREQEKDALVGLRERLIHLLRVEDQISGKIVGEEARLRGAGAPLDRSGELRGRFLNLDRLTGERLSRYREEALDYAKSREEIRRKKEAEERALEEIDRQRRKRKGLAFGFLGGAASAFLLGSGLLSMGAPVPFVIGLFLLAFSFGLLGFSKLVHASSFRAEDRARTRLGIVELEKELAQLSGRSEELRAWLKSLAGQLGYEDEERLLEDFRLYHRLHRETEELRRLRGDLEGLEVEIGEVKSTLRPFFEKAGREGEEVDPPSVKRLIDDVRGCLSTRGLLEQLAREVIQAQKGILALEEEGRLRARAQALKGLRPEHPSTHYLERQAYLSKQEHKILEGKATVLGRIAGDEKEYREAYPVLLTKREELNAHLQRAVAFKEAVETALEALRSISHDVHGRWSEALNEMAGGFLKELIPEYEDIRFDEDLGISLAWPGVPGRRGAKELNSPRFSAGTKDQLYLLVRLAVTEYLSRGREPLPLILDDPLVKADDESFRQAMRLILTRFAGHHQVIILTCHAERHRWLREVEPELFAGLCLVKLEGGFQAA